MLTLPFIIAASGFMLGGLMIMIGGLAAAFSCILLSRCAQNVQVPSSSYFSLIKAILGSKADRYLITILVIQIIGNCISYLIIITKIATKLLLDFGFAE